MFFILWFLLAFLVGSFAVRWKRSGVAYFLISAILSPPLGIIILLIIGDNNRKCPYCMKSSHPQAVVCSGCGRDIPPLSSERFNHTSIGILDRIYAIPEKKRTAIAISAVVLIALLSPKLFQESPVENIRLPVVTLGSFSNNEQAQLCGEILGRAVSCGFSLNKAIGLFSFCRSGIDGPDQNIYFKDGIELGKDNASGWSCDQIEMAPKNHEMPDKYITERLGREFIEYIE